MKNVSQLFVGLLSAIGSAVLVLAAASLALVEGGTIPLTLPTATQAVVSIPSPAPGETVTIEAQNQDTATPTLTETPACSGKPKDWVMYTIQDGDTIDSLIEQSGVSREDFLKANCFRSAPARLEAGWVVYLPPSLSHTPTATATETRSPEPPLPTVPVCGVPPGWIFYTVKPGDNLYRISLAFGISQEQLMQANCMVGTMIYVGQRLYVPNRVTITPVVTRTPTPTRTPVPPTRTVTPTINPTVTVTVTVTVTDTPTTPAPIKQDQTITLGALANKTYGDAPFQVSASASSGLTVTFSASGNCSISIDMVTITGAGSCEITASQPGDANFNPATPVKQSINIDKATATVTLAGTGSFPYDGNTHEVTATTNPPGLSVTITYSGSSNPPKDAGSYTVNATVNDANYQGSASDALIINPATQVIDFPTIGAKSLSDSPVSVSPTASSNLPVVLTSLTPVVCSVSSNTSIDLLTPGACSIRASQAGNNNYLPAQADQTFQVN